MPNELVLSGELRQLVAAWSELPPEVNSNDSNVIYIYIYIYAYVYIHTYIYIYICI